MNGIVCFLLLLLAADTLHRIDALQQPSWSLAQQASRRGRPLSIKTALRATTPLSPSDDSAYQQTEREDDNDDNAGTATSTVSFQALEIFHPSQSRVQLGDLVLVDPIDIIADWVSERFSEQSLQQSGNDHGGGNDSDYIKESYSPGSALDALRLASSTYTPLSYQIRTVVRVILPSILVAAAATIVYPSLAQWLVHLHVSGGEYASLDATKTAIDGTTNNLLYTDQVLTVLSNDLSQYVQNILTTCALLFGMLVGQTYYFMYQQQELVFYALFAEVTEAKSLLEQISLMSYGRPGLYPSLLSRMNDYVQNDLKLLSINDPIAVTSRLPKDDPLESILYATSVGLPGVVYETVKSLRQARANRCGALQRKLPTLHVYCLRLLGVIVLTTFPVCGSGSQAIAPNVLVLQSYMFGILAFELTLVLNVVEELRNSRKMGAYNVDGILQVMVGGLEQELEERLEGKFWGVGVSPGLPARVGTVEGGGNYLLVDKENDIAVDGSENSDKPHSSRKRIKNWLQRKVLGS